MPTVRRKYTAALQRFVLEAAAEGDQKSRTEMVEDLREWRTAELYWVNADMTQVALEAAETMPPWTPSQEMPSPSGWMYFDGQLPELPVVDSVRIDAFGQEVEEWRRPTWVAWAWRWVDGVRHLQMKYGVVGPSDVSARPVPISSYGETFLPIEEDRMLDPNPDFDGPHPMRYATELLMFMGAVWHLMKQPSVATARVDRVRPQGVSKKAPATEVNVVTLRQMRYVEAERSDSGRVYTHRWVVNGHWRQQRSGAGLSVVSPVWIPSYVKGPRGAPLKLKERVMVWRR